MHVNPWNNEMLPAWQFSPTASEMIEVDYSALEEEAQKYYDNNMPNNQLGVPDFHRRVIEIDADLKAKKKSKKPNGQPIPQNNKQQDLIAELMPHEDDTMLLLAMEKEAPLDMPDEDDEILILVAKHL